MIKKKLYPLLLLGIFFIMGSCTTKQSNEFFAFTKEKALEVVKTGFNAGDGYGEVWIRDYNTFIELSAEVFEPSVLKENLLVFFRMQGDDGNIIDGFIPREKTEGQAYDYIYSELEPRYAGHKNTVETDQESSLVQALYKYVRLTGDRSILDEIVGGKSVAERLNGAMEFLLNHRFNSEYGLIWGATTADWGDVQPEHDWGVYFTEDTHYAIDIYDNAMFLIALDNLMELVPAMEETWQPVRKGIADKVRRHLWDEEKQKFIPHIYLNGSPFPDGFNEDDIFYHGGTAIAIEAGLLSKEEIKVSLDKMIANVEASGAGSIRFGFVEEAYAQLQPMVERVKENDGFFEWYTVDNEPKGSGTFRGSAGVLYKAIIMLED
jgi:glycogen debranching enzyme